MRTYVIDLCGADRGSDVILQGLKKAMEQADFSAVLVGPDAQAVSAAGLNEDRICFVPAADEIKNTDPPTAVFRGKPEASMSKAFAYLKEHQQTDGLFSCGSTGALLVGSIFCLGLIEGIKCPVLCSVLPCEDEKNLVALLDCGANMDCTAQDLQRFAVMGSSFIKSYLGIQNPKVALLNVGTEPGKGNKVLKEAYGRIEELGLNFAGNIEGGDVLTGAYDVVVCDGYAGNLILKNAEHVGLNARRLVQELMKTDASPELAALSERLFLTYDFNSRGGATFLGTKKLIVKGHGAANAETVSSSLLQLHRMVQGEAASRLAEDLKSYSAALEK